MADEVDNSDNLISQFVNDLDPGAMVTKFVVVAEGIDTSGERAVYTATHEGANSWDILGLLNYAIGRENAALAKSAIEEDDED